MTDADLILVDAGDSVSNVVSLKKRARSPVWDHFVVSEENPKQAVCKHCRAPKNKYAYNNGGTKNLLNHIENKHPHVLNTEEQGEAPKMKQKKIEDVLLVYSQSGFEELLYKWIVKRNHSFQEVESPEFQNMIKLLRPGVKVFSADTLKRNILGLFEAKREEVKAMFASLKTKVSFTMDCWTSPNNISFMGVTCHFISEDWKLCRKTLDFAPLRGAHTGAALFEKFVEILTTFGLKQKAMGVTLDNASNNNKFIEYLDESTTSFNKFFHVRCFAHIINLAVQAGLSVITEELEMLRKGIRSIRSSPQALEKFKEIQHIQQLQENGNPCTLKPILDVRTRWNSTAEMLERALLLKPYLISYFSSHDAIKNTKPTEMLSIPGQAWGKFGTILRYLKPLKKASELACGDSYPSVSFTIPYYCKILAHLDLWLQRTNPTDSLHRAAVASIAKVKEYYDVTSGCYTIATVLDPRFNLAWYKTSEAKLTSYHAKDVFEFVESIYNALYKPKAEESDIDETEELEDEDQFSLYGETKTTPGTELTLYVQLDAVKLPGLKDVLQWWVQQSSTFPNLSRMAKDYLAIPATSAPSERLFSSGSELLTDKRNALSPSTVQACQCLKSWL